VLDPARPGDADVRCGVAGTYSAPRLERVEDHSRSRYGRSTNGLDFRVLGPLQVAANGTLLPLGGAKQRAVLALLLLHANEVVSIDRLIDEVWGDSPPDSAANMLQGYVSHLRKTLEPGRSRGEHELLLSRAPGYVLRIRPDQVDAQRFVRLTSEGRRLLDEGDATAAAGSFREALNLWRGPALDDLVYEPFARADAERLDELRLAAIEDRIDADLALGRHDVLVPELRELVARHPVRERLRAQLMAALYRSGRQAEALDVYRDARRALNEELGIEPGPALKELEQAILRQDPALGTPARPPAPIVSTVRRRWPVLAAAAGVAGAALASVFAFGPSSRANAVVVKPNSVAVIDPKKDELVDDVHVGAYPGPLASDESYVFVCNIGEATLSRIIPTTRKVFDTGSLSRAIDLVAVNKHVWAANGGVSGHTPFPPGTIVDYDLLSAEARTFPLGPPVEGNESQTTIAADDLGAEIWAGNQESETVTQLEPATMLKVHGVAPGGLAVVGGGLAGDTVWASDPTRNLVARIDGDSARVIRRIRVPGQPIRLAADAKAVWVTTLGRGDPAAQWSPTRGTTPALWRIDPRTNEIAARIPLPLTPVRIALGAGSVWVTAERVLSSAGPTVDATVFRIDPATNRIVARIPLHTRAVDGIIVSHGLVWAAVPPSQ
jgi:DNA-binding SARP family transcriptional activator